MTAAAVLVAVVAMVAIAALGHPEDLLPTLPGWVAVVGKVVTYLILALAGAGGAATLGRVVRSVGWPWGVPLVDGTRSSAAIADQQTSAQARYVTANTNAAQRLLALGRGPLPETSIPRTPCIPATDLAAA